MEEIIFPNKIRIVRKTRGVPMQDLAKLLNISLSAISKIEKGYRRIDQEQLIKIVNFLNCDPADVLISEEDKDDSEIIKTWKSESEKRVKANEHNGLKVLGAALRHIRSARNLTLSEIAEGANMTLSVYHRIEMGQREVSEKEFAGIAAAMGISVNELFNSIYELNESGALDKFVQKGAVKLRAMAKPSSGAPQDILGLSGSSYSVKLQNMFKARHIQLYGRADSDGNIIINKEEDASTIIAPIVFENPETVYALRLCTRRLGNLLPARSILFVDPKQAVGVGDIALLYDNLKEDKHGNMKAKLISLKEDDKGKLYGVMYNPEEKIKISENSMDKLHRVIFISLA